MTSNYVRFTWTSNAFDKNYIQDARTGLTDHGSYYEVWFDEGESGRPISSFVVLASNLGETGFTYRDFTTKY
jgi:hypothetical protein